MEDIIEFLYDSFTYIVLAIALTIFLFYNTKMNESFALVNSYDIDYNYSQTNYVSNEYEVFGYEIVGQFYSGNENIFVDGIIINSSNYTDIDLQKKYAKKEQYLNGGVVIKYD